VKEYLDGLYDDEDLPLPSTIVEGKARGGKKPKKSVKHVQEKTVGKSNFDDIYEKTVGSARYRIFTTNVSLFRAYVAELTVSDDDSVDVKPKKSNKGVKISQPAPDVSRRFATTCDH